MSRSAQPPQASLWANRRCLVICCVVAMANLEFGMDSGIVGSLQAIPGFLAVFGYANPFIPGGYGLNVRLPSVPVLSKRAWNLMADTGTAGNSPPSSN